VYLVVINLLTIMMAPMMAHIKYASVTRMFQHLKAYHSCTDRSSYTGVGASLFYIYLCFQRRDFSLIINYCQFSFLILKESSSMITSCSSTASIINPSCSIMKLEYLTFYFQIIIAIERRYVIAQNHIYNNNTRQFTNA
jgi:hypothetical protein